MREVDNRGLNCPEPVLRTKKALSKNPQGLISIVDHVAARENVIRMAQKEGFSTRWEEKKRRLLCLYHCGGRGSGRRASPGAIFNLLRRCGG